MATFHLSSFDRFTKIFLPAAAPQVFAGARIAIAISVTVMVVAEMFGTPGGVGYYIRDAQSIIPNRGDVDWNDHAWNIRICAQLSLYVLEKRVLRWHYMMVAHTQGASQ